MILRLEDTSKRQNKLIHQLQDKVEMLSSKIKPAGSLSAVSQPPAQSSVTQLREAPDSQPTAAPSPRTCPLYPALPQTEPTASIQQAERISCPDCRFSCSSMTSLDEHIARNHGRPNHCNGQGLTLMIGDSSMTTVNSRVVEAALGGGLLSGRSATRQGPRSPLAGHPGRAYNSVSSYPGCKYPESSFERVVPRLLSSRTITNLVLQSPTSDITNLKEVPESQHKEIVIQSARNMFTIMERARADHETLRKIVTLEQLPRADNEHFSSLSSLYNSTLRQLVAAAPLINGCEMVMAGHSSLLATTKDSSYRSALFGSPSARKSDGIHFRGNAGKNRHTSSIIAALKSAGLGGSTGQAIQGAARSQSAGTYSQAVQRGRRAAPRQQDTPFSLITSNQFEVLGN